MVATLELVTKDGVTKRVQIPVRLLTVDGEAVLRILEFEGVEISPEPGSRKMALDYLISTIAAMSSPSG